MDKNDVTAAIFGSVVADALGVPYEFTSLKEMNEHPATDMIGFGTHNQPPGTWSDDSSMTLATLDSLLNGVNYTDMIEKFSHWLFNDEYNPYDEVFDCGITVRSALTNYYIGNSKPLKSGMAGERDNGNGSLMRIMPISLYVYGMDVDKQIEIVNNVSSLTHAHKISKASCNIYNFIVQEILNNNHSEDFKILIQRGLDKSRKFYDNEEYDCFEKLYSNLFSISEEDLNNKGYVVYSLEIALYCCYHTDNYKECVLKAVNFGGDTDTNAMIAGGLAGLYYGFDSIPNSWLNQIAKLDYIYELCNKFNEKINE